MIEGVRRNRGKILIVILCVIAGAWAYSSGWISIDNLTAWGRTLPLHWLVVAFLVLPLLGFPVNVFLVLAGAKFGFGWGMIFAAAGICVHHGLAFAVACKWFHGRIQGWLERSGYSIPTPRDMHPWLFTSLFVGVQGPPYAMKLYLLALTDVSFAVYFGGGVPIYILFSMISVGIGSSATHFNPQWILILVTFMIVVICGGRWLRNRHGRSVEVAGDAKCR